MVIQTPHMTAPEFLALPDSTLPIELIHGEVIVSPTPIPQHQRLIGRLYMLLNRLIPNGEVFIAPLVVYLDEENVVQPDVMWVAEDGTCTILEKYLQGVPDLVVEVLSPRTARHDKSTKFTLYEQHGAQEYWMLDPVGQYIEVWRRQDDYFVRQGVFGPEDTFDTEVLGKQMIALNAISTR